jgi:hypothetical protein
VQAVESGPEQYRLIHLRTSHIGPDTLLVAGKIGVSAELTAVTLAAGINATEERIRAAVPIAETIYLEPDIYHPEQEDLTDPSIAVVQRTSRRPRLPRRRQNQPPGQAPGRGEGQQGQPGR